MTKVRGFEVAKGFEDKNINLPVRATARAAGYDFEASDDIVIPSVWDIKEIHKKSISSILSKDLFGFNIDLQDPDSISQVMEHLTEVESLELFSKVTDFLTKITQLLKDKGVDLEELASDPASYTELFNTLNLENQNNEILKELLSDEAISEIKTLSKQFKPVLVPTGVKAYMEPDEYLALFNRSSNPLKRFLVLTNGVGVIDGDYYSNPDNDGHIMFQFLNFGPETIYIKKGERIGQGVFSKFLLVDDDNAQGERLGGHGSTGVK